MLGAFGAHAKRYYSSRKSPATSVFSETFHLDAAEFARCATRVGIIGLFKIHEEIRAYAHNASFEQKNTRKTSKALRNYENND